MRFPSKVVPVLALAMVFSALVLPATSFAAERNPPAKAAISPIAVIKFGFDVYGKVNACLKNIDVKQPCLASDAQNIRTILTEVRALSSLITENQKRTENRLEQLQTTLYYQNLRNYIDELKPLEKNAKKALLHWKRISECMANALEKKETCTGANGHPSPIKAAVSELKVAFINQAKDAGGDDPETEVAHFAGSRIDDGKNGLAFSAWIVNKNRQDSEAVANDQIGKETSPVVTHQLAVAQNFIIEYYAELLQAYGFIKPLAAAMTGDKSRAIDLQRRVQEEVYDAKEPYSVAAMAKKMSLPKLEKGQILVRSTSNVLRSALFYNTKTPRSGETKLNYGAIAELGRWLNLYAPVSKLRESNPDSFPADHGWYGIEHAVTRPLVNPYSQSGKNLLTTSYYVNRLSRTSKGTLAGHFYGVRPVDEKPIYPSGTIPDPAGVTPRTNFEDEFNHFITGPAEFKWDVLPTKTLICGEFCFEQIRSAGTGAWVKPLAGTNALKGVLRVVDTPRLMKP